MAHTARLMEYFYTTVNTKVDEAHEVLNNLASMGVNFVALTLVPIGPDTTQLTLFPEDASHLQAIAKQIGLSLTGPHTAVIVQGDDEIGALAGIQELLRQENVHIFASNAVTDGNGHFGCILFLRPEAAGRALRALSGRH